MKNLEITIQTIETRELSTIASSIGNTLTMEVGAEELGVFACCCCCCSC